MRHVSEEQNSAARTTVHTRRWIPPGACGGVKIGRKRGELYVIGGRRRPEADSVHAHFTSPYVCCCRSFPRRPLRRMTGEEGSAEGQCRVGTDDAGRRARRKVRSR
jgi:hypothetical protein